MRFDAKFHTADILFRDVPYDGTPWEVDVVSNYNIGRSSK